MWLLWRSTTLKVEFTMLFADLLLRQSSEYNISVSEQCRVQRGLNSNCRFTALTEMPSTKSSENCLLDLILNPSYNHQSITNNIQKVVFKETKKIVVKSLKRSEKVNL